MEFCCQIYLPNIFLFIESDVCNVQTDYRTKKNLGKLSLQWMYPLQIS